MTKGYKNPRDIYFLTIREERTGPITECSGKIFWCNTDGTFYSYRPEKQWWEALDHEKSDHDRLITTEEANEWFPGSVPIVLLVDNQLLARRNASNSQSGMR